MIRITVLCCLFAGACAEPDPGALGFEPDFVKMLGQRQGVDKPRDLEFHPTRDAELWVLNKGVESSGSEVVVAADALGSDDTEVLQDGNAWHFMNTSSSLAFSNNGNFATTPEVTDANHAGGTFTGPTLWSSDPDIFAQPSAGNGSHLDMLHGSPNAMGIASERGNIFWVFDGYNQEIVRYDFQEDHGPGADDHTDGLIHRYTSMKMKRKNNVPSHMVLDDERRWLYIADAAKGRLLRMDITTGDKVEDLPLLNEALEEHWQMENEVWEVLVEGLDTPSGIALDGGTLYVGDHGTGEIVLFDTAGLKLGRVQTPAERLYGLEVGPEGMLWYVDGAANSIVRVQPFTD